MCIYIYIIVFFHIWRVFKLGSPPIVLRNVPLCTLFSRDVIIIFSNLEGTNGIVGAYSEIQLNAKAGFLAVFYGAIIIFCHQKA